jgi:hypothetical protein
MRKRKIDQKQGAAPDSLILEPWFLPHKITYAIRALLPPEHRLKLRDYFAEWGCLRCGNRERHWSSGLCEKCYNILHHRIGVCLRRRAAVIVPDKIGLKHVEDVRTARRLLKGFPAKMYVKPQQRTKYRIDNPAQAAFIVITQQAHPRLQSEHSR